jgi:AsmA-like C-terminal region
MRNLSNVGRFRFNGHSFLRKWQRPLLWGLAVVLTIWIWLLASNWPFTQKAVVAALERQSRRTVRIGTFHSTLIPLGYVAENLNLVNATAKKGEDTFAVRKLVIVARWSDLLLLRKRIEQASISGLRVRVPALPDARGASRSITHERESRFTEIGQIQLEDAAFAFPSFEEDPDPFTITVQSFSLNVVSRTSSSPFNARVLINDPQTTVHSTGQIGPWDWNNPGRTPLSGSFNIVQGDLSGLGGIAGNFTGKGSFRGPLDNIACTGTVDVPQFGINGSNRSAYLATTFHVTVNGLNGDTTLDQVESQLSRTVIHSQGTIEADPQRPGKDASLRLSVDAGYIEDFLSLFTRDAKPSMTGIFSVRAKVGLPAGPPGFLKKLSLEGDFSIDQGRFTRIETQTRINRLSKSAEGMSKTEGKVDPSLVFADLKGHVVAHGGTATLSHSVLTAPGAHADIAGTYGLIDETLHLRGILRTTGSLSDTTSGFKTALLKLVAPFWKHHSESVVPFTISGKARKPAFALGLVK